LRADEALLVANFEQAEANHQRALTLKSNGFMSDQNILQLETQVKTTRALLDAKRLQMRYTDVVAPDDGAVSARSATLGSIATTGQELFRLVRQNRLEWRGELSARQLMQVQLGQAVRLSLPNGENALATVRQAAPTLNADSRLGLVYADLEADSQARAGMYATGTDRDRRAAGPGRCCRGGDAARRAHICL
jgi:multidrug resistance efflux pump